MTHDNFGKWVTFWAVVIVAIVICYCFDERCRDAGGTPITGFRCIQTKEIHP